jgi:dihydrofolate reductase
MTRIIYNTASTLNGFIADSNNNLRWLFDVEHDESDAHETFMRDISVLVEGSTTYEWVLREQDLLAQPGQWQHFYGDRPTFVFTTRTLPVPDDADVCFVRGTVANALPQLREAATEGNIWVVGGGDLAGQFLDIDALDEIQVSIAPVVLETGAPLLPRRVESARLRLSNMQKRGQFVHITYGVDKTNSS